ncbi:MAG: recombination protein RecR, partial [Campylobacter sp.]|nr:recombination protein RecR [Campylobacter sp.]
MKKNLAQKFDELVASFEKLPGVGKKSALKYAYFVGVENSFMGLNLAHCIEEAVKNLRRCEICGGICESEICEVCADFGRNRDKICIVETPKDIFIFENNNIFDGLYFVLDDVNEQILARLEKMIDENGSDELIFALTPSVNSDGIMLYIEDKLKHKSIKFSKIAQGIPTNVSLENV